MKLFNFHQKMELNIITYFVDINSSLLSAGKVDRKIVISNEDFVLFNSAIIFVVLDNNTSFEVTILSIHITHNKIFFYLRNALIEIEISKTTTGNSHLKRIKFENQQIFRQKMIFQRLVPFLALVLCRDFERAGEDIEPLIPDAMDLLTECP